MLHTRVIASYCYLDMHICVMQARKKAEREKERARAPAGSLHAKTRMTPATNIAAGDSKAADEDVPVPDL
jgi:hypothetical protein